MNYFKIYLLSFFFVQINFLYANDKIFQLNGEILITSYIEKEIVSVSYTGHLNTEIVEIIADPNKKYVFIPIKYKNYDTNIKFIPKKIHLSINGRIFKRLKDIDIMDKLELRSFPFLDINFGEHKGFIVYEIPSNIKFKTFSIEYFNFLIKIEKITKIFNY